MISRDALEFLQQTIMSAANPASNALLATVNNSGCVPFVSLPEKMQLHSLEKYLPAPKRFRGKFSTDSLASWTDYVKQSQVAEEPLQVFIGKKQLLAYAVFDAGTRDKPGHGEHSAQVTLDRNAHYSAMLAVNGQRQSQLDLAEWLEEWREYLSPILDIEGTVDIEKLSLKQAINAVRHIDIKATQEASHKVENFGAQKTALERIEASSQHTLPWGFSFCCNPYPGISPSSFIFRLTLITGNNPQLVLRCVNLEELQESIAAEFAAHVTGELANQPGISVYIGSFSK